MKSLVAGSSFVLLLTACAHRSERLVDPTLVDTPEKTKAIFALGDQAVPRLRNAGAKIADHVSPHRLDIVYTLITKPNPDGVKKDSFGVTFKKGTERGQIQKLQSKYQLKSERQCDLTSYPNCYLSLQKSESLTQVMKDILSNEKDVETVSFNFFENSTR